MHTDIDNSFFQIPNASHVRLTHVSPSLMWMDNTTLYRRIQPRALNRREWIKIVHKPTKQHQLRAAGADGFEQRLTQVKKGDMAKNGEFQIR